MSTLTAKISQVELNPDPLRFVDLRLYVKELEARQKAEREKTYDDMSECWAVAYKCQKAAENGAAVTAYLDELIHLLKPYADEWTLTAEKDDVKE